MAEDADARELERQKISINDLLMDCITILRRTGDHEVAFDRLLGLVASFYGADRSYVFEFDLDSQRLSNTYEWCAEGIEAEISKLQNMDISIVDRWIVQFEAHGEFYINSIDGDLDHDSDEYKILAMQDIQSLMAAPLRLGGDIVGFLGVDNPRDNTNTLLVLQAVSSFVVNQLGKQREEQQRMMLTALTDDYDVLVRSDVDRDTFAVLRASDGNLEHWLEPCSCRSLSAFLDRLGRLSEEGHGAFHAHVNPDSIASHLTQGHALLHNFRLADEEGDSTTYQVRIVPVGAWPESRRILLGIHNIEETVRAEESQRRMLREALDKAERANRAKTSFLSNMSHEIRTPMNAIIGLDSIALSDPGLTPHAREQLEKIGSSARHLLGIINDILDMSRIESGRVELRDEEFSLREFLDQINVMAGGQCADKGLRYECEIVGSTEDYYIGDEVKLRQVLINILGNAVKFTPAGSVTLTVEQTGGFEDLRSLRFTVSDTGIGMSQDYIPKIFEAFSKETEGSSNKLGSTGLGMAITKSIVSMMGGDIAVESERGVGSTFTVTLTLRTSGRSARAADGGTIPGGLRALVADDDPAARERAQLVAESVGIRTDVAADGAEALAMIRSRMEQGEPYRLVMAAWGTPGVDGVALAREVRGTGDAEAVVVLLTDYDWEGDREAVAEAGVDAILSKPLFADTLSDCVEGVLSRRNHGAQADQAAVLDGAAGMGLEGRLVLVVEDVELNAEILMDLLELEGVRSERAENGRVAVDMFSGHPAGHYDAILMDMRMPVMDGLEATRAIRALDRPDARDIPIIAMTANAFDEDVKKSLQAGMNAHLSKPVEIERLYETLGQMIKHTG